MSYFCHFTFKFRLTGAASCKITAIRLHVKHFERSEERSEEQSTLNLNDE